MIATISPRAKYYGDLASTYMWKATHFHEYSDTVYCVE